MSALCEIFHFRGGEGQCTWALSQTAGEAHTSARGRSRSDDGYGGWAEAKTSWRGRQGACMIWGFAVKATIELEAGCKGKQRNGQQQERD